MVSETCQMMIISYSLEQNMDSFSITVTTEQIEFQSLHIITSPVKPFKYHNL